MDENFIKMYETMANNITKYGWSIVGVPSSRETMAYTIGNSLRGLPELLIIIPAPPHLAMAILNSVGAKQRESGGPLPVGLVGLDDFNVKFKLRVASAAARSEHTIQCGQFRRHVMLPAEDYLVMQVLAPDKFGVYPDEPGCVAPFDVALA